MRYDEFQDRLTDADLTIAAFAELVRANANSFSNCKKADHIPDHWGIVVTLMVEMRRAGIDFRAALQQLDIQPKRPRGGSKVGRYGWERQYPLEIIEPISHGGRDVDPR